LLFGGASSDGSIAYGGGLFAYADGTTTVGGVPTRLSFVTGSNSGDRAERLKIASTGGVTVTSTLGVTGATTLNGDLNLTKVTPAIVLTNTGNTAKGRTSIYSASPNSYFHTANAYFDGSNWQRDDTAITSVVKSLDAGSATVLERLRYSAAGSGAITLSTAYQVNTGGVFQVPKLGAIADSTTAMQFFKADGTTAVATIDTTNSMLGVGVTPSAKIHSLATTEQLRLGYDANNYLKFTTSSSGLTTITPVTNGAGNTAAETAFSVTKTDVTATSSAVSISSTLNPTADLATYRLNGLYNTATKAGNFKATAGQSIRALQNQVSNTGAGNVTGMAAFTNYVSQTGTGTITNAYGGYFIAPAASATNPITNYYHLYLESPIVTGITTPYSIYSVGGNNYFGGNFGVGVTPSAKFHVLDTKTALTGNVWATQNFLDWTPSGNEGTYAGSAQQAGTYKHGSSNVTTSIRGSRVFFENDGSGTITDAVGQQVYMSQQGTGTITNAKGFEVMAPAGTSATKVMTNVYGVYINAINRTGITNPYGIYQAGTEDTNYFAGRVNIANNLNVTGNITASTGYKVGTSTGLTASYNCTSYPNVTITGGIITSFSC
jgi:hypothetical protein